MNPEQKPQTKIKIEKGIYVARDDIKRFDYISDYVVENIGDIKDENESIAEYIRQSAESIRTIELTDTDKIILSSENFIVVLERELFNKLFEDVRDIALFEVAVVKINDDEYDVIVFNRYNADIDEVRVLPDVEKIDERELLWRYGDWCVSVVLGLAGYGNGYVERVEVNNNNECLNYLFFN